MAFTKPQSGDTILHTHVTQLTNALDGTSGGQQVIALTQLNDASNYALDVRNQDTTNSYCQRWLDAAGSIMGRFIGTTAGYFETLKKIKVTIGTITTGQKHIDITGTWNAGGETFYGIFENITNTASAAASRLVDLQVAGNSKFDVDVSGNISADGNLTLGGNLVGQVSAIGSAVGAAGANTGSGTYVDMTDMSVTLTCKGGDLLVWWSGSLGVGGVAQQIYVGVKLDSDATINKIETTLDSAGYHDGMAFVHRYSGVSAASHTVKVQWYRVGANDASVEINRALAVAEVKT